MRTAFAAAVLAAGSTIFSTTAGATTAYGYDTVEDRIIGIDLTTRAQTLSLPSPRFLSAMAISLDGDFLGINGLNNTLVGVDFATGAQTLVGPVTGLPFGFAFSSLDFAPDGVLYGIYGGGLVTVNPTTAVATSIGSLGPDFIGSSSVDLAVSPSGDLFVLKNDGDLGRVDVTDGRATVIGNIGTINVDGIDFDPAGSLIAFTGGGFLRVNLDPVGALLLGETALGFTDVRGFAIDPRSATAVPAPAAAGLLAFGSAALVLMRRRRRA